MKLKPPVETFDFKRNFIEQAKVLSGRKYAKAYLIGNFKKDKEQ
jgi:hypothetical protein